MCGLCKVDWHPSIVMSRVRAADYCSGVPLMQRHMTVADCSVKDSESSTCPYMHNALPDLSHVTC